MQARDELWSAGQAADCLHCSRQNVSYLRATGQLPATRVRSGWLYHRAAIERFALEREGQRQVKQMVAV